MLKQRKTQVLLGVVGFCALTVGAAIPILKWHEQKQPSSIAVIAPDGSFKKQVSAFKALPPAQRTKALEAIVKDKEAPERSRARYLLAAELIEQGQGKKALESLQGLETSYPILGAYVLRQRAQAYEAMGDRTRVQATQQQLLKAYPQSPVAAEALAALGRDNPRYGDQAIAQFPSHPSTIELVQQRLKQNPKQPQLLLLIAKHALYAQNYLTVLDDLTEHYATQLQPEDWERSPLVIGKNNFMIKRALPIPMRPILHSMPTASGGAFSWASQGGRLKPISVLFRTFPTPASRL